MATGLVVKVVDGLSRPREDLFDGFIVEHVGESVGTDEQEVAVVYAVGDVFCAEIACRTGADAVNQAFAVVGIARKPPDGFILSQLPQDAVPKTIGAAVA